MLHVEGDVRQLTIAAAQPVEDGPGRRLSFEEVPDRQRAEPLRVAYLELAVARSTDLEAGAAYWHEVVGATVRDSTGAVLGSVADVYRAGETEVYVVRGGDPGEFDVPAVREIITTFAPERGEIVVDEAVLDLGSAPVEAQPRTRKERRRPRWSRHGKGARSATGLDPKAASNDGAQHASDATPEPPSTGEGAP